MIGVFKKKTELPEYLAHYGMHRAPFSAAVENDMYYAEPTRKQRLDILLHLAQNTNELLVLTGEQGMGKTMFLSQFVVNTGEHWKVCQVEGHKMMTEEQFLQRVYLGFDIAHASVHKSTMLANLKKRLDSLLQQALPVILLVDDAHLFSTKVLSLILEIASIRNIKTGNSVRVILFSEPQIKIILAEPELDEKHKLIVRKIDLPPLDEIHTGNYLHHRLSQAGMEAERFLTKPTIHKIFKQSKGIPAAINEAADKLLFETTPIIRRTSNVQAKQKVSVGKYIAIIIVLAAVSAAIYIYRDVLVGLIKNAGVSVNHTELTEEKSTEEKSTEEKSAAKTITSPETITPLKLPALNSNTTTDSTSTESTTTDSTDPMQSLKEELSNKTVEQSTEQKPPEAVMQDKTEQTRSATAQPSETIPTENLPASSKSNNRLKNARWILQQNPEHYTLQLVTGHQRTTIDNFITKYQLQPQQLAYFYSTRNEKQWHNLIYKVYPDRKTAHSAIKQLPPQLASVKPWIRQIASIQSEISKAQ
ncbi:AAA family ATPase [Kaarinaea lacus]